MSVAPAVPAEDLPKRPSPSGTADSLQGAVHAALAASAYHPVRLLDYEVTKGIVVLAGTVPSFYMKQIAQTIVMKIDGVNGIDNRLRVENGNHPSRLGHC